MFSHTRLRCFHLQYSMLIYCIRVQCAVNQSGWHVSLAAQTDLTWIEPCMCSCLTRIINLQIKWSFMLRCYRFTFRVSSPTLTGNCGCLRLRLWCIWVMHCIPDWNSPTQQLRDKLFASKETVFCLSSDLSDFLLLDVSAMSPVNRLDFLWCRDMLLSQWTCKMPRKGNINGINMHSMYYVVNSSEGSSIMFIA